MLSRAERARGRAELYAASERAFAALCDRGYSFDFDRGGARLADARVIQRGFDPPRVPSRARSPEKARKSSRSTFLGGYDPATAAAIVMAYRRSAPLTTEQAKALAYHRSWVRWNWNAPVQ